MLFATQVNVSVS